ncbi:aminoglycoside phosphotransferase family protein [Mycoplasma sp. P36-A1]|uniref:aminoglycoside phosphotransferase family protein n=1 Tax=Mycoplasma sp. P36-A1 TaxID=3252900 RepID=UPI003C304F38
MFTGFVNIPGFSTWKEIVLLNLGFGNDKKYYIEDEFNNKMLLRVSPIQLYQEKKQQALAIQQLNNKAVSNIPKLLSFGTCNNNKSVYLLLDWIEGSPFDQVIERLEFDDIYTLGIKTGKLLKEIHAIPANDTRGVSVQTIKTSKTFELIYYENSEQRLENDQPIIEFIKNNLFYYENSPITYIHNDFYQDKMIFKDNELYIIDFDRLTISEPYEDFCKLELFDTSFNHIFTTGVLIGYFDGQPPTAFWNIHALNIAHNILTLQNWAVNFKSTFRHKVKLIGYKSIDYYNCFNSMIPKWYQQNINVLKEDGKI